jgi:hypothetical protein
MSEITLIYSFNLKPKGGDVRTRPIRIWRDKRELRMVCASKCFSAEIWEEQYIQNGGPSWVKLDSAIIYPDSMRKDKTGDLMEAVLRHEIAGEHLTATMTTLFYWLYVKGPGSAWFKKNCPEDFKEFAGED